MSAKQGFLSLIFAFKIPARLHLGLHDVIWLPNDALLPNNSGNQMTSQNPRWRCAGNLKVKIGNNLELLLNIIFTLSSKI